MRKIIVILSAFVLLVAVCSSSAVGGPGKFSADMCTLIDDIGGGGYGHGTTGYELRPFTIYVDYGPNIGCYLEGCLCCVKCYNYNRACETDMEVNSHLCDKYIDREDTRGGLPW